MGTEEKAVNASPLLDCAAGCACGCGADENAAKSSPVSDAVAEAVACAAVGALDDTAESAAKGSCAGGGAAAFDCDADAKASKSRSPVGASFSTGAETNAGNSSSVALRAIGAADAKAANSLLPTGSAVAAVGKPASQPPLVAESVRRTAAVVLPAPVSASVLAPVLDGWNVDVKLPKPSSETVTDVVGGERTEKAPKLSSAASTA